VKKIKRISPPPLSSPLKGEELKEDIPFLKVGRNEIS